LALPKQDVVYLFQISISFEEVNSIPVEGRAKKQTSPKKLWKKLLPRMAIAQKQSFHFEHLCQASSALEIAPNRIFIPSKESGEIV